MEVYVGHVLVGADQAEIGEELGGSCFADDRLASCLI